MSFCTELVYFLYLFCLVETSPIVSINGQRMELTENEVKLLTFNFTETDRPVKVFIQSSNTEIFTVIAGTHHNITDGQYGNFSTQIHGEFLGRAELHLYVNKYFQGTQPSEAISERAVNETWYKVDDSVDIVVKRADSPLNTVFTSIVIILVCLANIAMGCKTELKEVRKTMRRPVAPVTGLLSQFILMPLISLGVGYLLGLNAALWFGFFAMGSSPGGAASNIYCYLLDGDVSLSVTMTFISTLSSLALIPAWIYSVGVNVIYKDIEISIPFTNIIISLIGLIIPVGIGILIQTKRPKWAKFIEKLVRPITVIFVILVFTVGVYANLYVFKLLTPVTLLAGALVPYCGFFFGAVVAFLTRHDRQKILTIAIETGIQNTGISIVMLQLSLPLPDSDIGIVAPIICSVFTPIPMAIAIISYEIKKRCCTKKPPNSEKMGGLDKVANAENSEVKGLSYQPVTEKGSDSEADATKEMEEDGDVKQKNGTI
ncbi:ileal sodium/bile acid cotransporter-like [Saccostrea echinata]|uniref:ileal sodium/bile acid cotransporter-like n=1 Tax=Saccostrea echinata TaxID=191078 RepID=UPI002A83508C|nr:ileal sodium/bile acid cotransporter-like [Saccostrea echinata]